MVRDVGGAAEGRRLDEERVAGLARLLVRAAASMGDQAEFHRGGAVDSGIRTLRDGAARAERRLGSVAHAGSRWLREIEKTLLTELARAAWLADAVCDEAGPEAWPDLSVAADDCRREVRAAAARDPSLFAPIGFDAAGLKSRESASLGGEAAWRKVEDGCFAAVTDLGVPLTVAVWGHGGGRLWLASVGGVGVGLFPDAEGAAARAEAANRSLFGGVPEAPALAC